ncbi:MAG: hypothetical protein HOK04_01965 [Verrucomicrobia bacterium]|nr:hypothetical protein [Verrucomicrobiota bacterium]
MSLVNVSVDVDKRWPAHSPVQVNFGEIRRRLILHRCYRGDVSATDLDVNKHESVAIGAQLPRATNDALGHVGVAKDVVCPVRDVYPAHHEWCEDLQAAGPY